MLIVPSWVPTLIGSVALALASGLVGWIWALWRDHHALKLKLAENYPNNTVFKEFREEVKELRYIVWEIAKKLEVPVLRRE